MAAALVGGAFLSSFLNVLFDRIASKEVINYFRYQKLNEGHLRKLRTVLRSVNKLLGDAEVKQIDAETVREWLDELKDAFYEADDLLDEIAYEARRAALNTDSQDASTGMIGRILASLNSSEKPDFVARIEEVLEKFKDLLDQKNELGLMEGAEHSPLSQFERRTTSLLNESRVYGRDVDKKAIIKELISEESESRSGQRLKVIPIVGMGGVGKTTLAQLIYGDDRVKEWFHLQAWVCVAEEIDVFRVTRNILKGFAPENTSVDGSTVDQLHTELKKKLEGQRFLLVLDDIWDDCPNFWDTMMKPLEYGGQGSRIIVTTRTKTVASVASTTLHHHLEVLSDSDCWSIFEQRAFDGEHSSGYPDLEAIGRKIVGKCKGLPLAANALGCLLRTIRRDVREWKKILESNIWDIKNGNILPALRLSYTYLPSNLKRCFAYCAIIPKDYQFTKEKLILLWMAEGFLDSHDQKMEMEEIGQECFDGLVARSFFQQDGDTSCFVMHDLINDLAKSVAGDFCFRAEGNTYSSKAVTRIHHLSYERKYYIDREKFNCNISEAQNLRTLLPNDSFGQPESDIRGINKEVLEDLLSLKRLRVLNLSEYININDLPDSIGRMKHLRYLDLSRIGISKLPDVIGNAYNLQTLNLEYCRSLVELPDSIVTLKYLHYLNLGGTEISKLPMMGQFCQLKTLILSHCRKLVELPDDIISLLGLCHLNLKGTRIQQMPLQFGNLIHLQTLTDFYVGNQVGHDIKELQKLHNLQGDFNIWNLQNVACVDDVMVADLKDKKYLERLELIWEGDANDSSHEKNVLESLEPHTGLQHLSIIGYEGTTFSDWVGRSSFTKIVSLTLHRCKNCCELPPLGRLQLLKELHIIDLVKVVYVGPNFYGDQSCATKSAFESLKILRFTGMSEWKTWENTEGAFPRLEELSIKNCPKLVVNLPSHLPCLTGLCIKGCTKINFPYPRSSALQQLTLSDNYYNLSLEDWSSDKSRPVLCVTGAESLDTVLREIVQMGTLSSRIIGLECTNVNSLPQHIDSFLPSLVDLELKDCPKIESFLEGSLPPKLESLVISGCDGLIANRTKWYLHLFPSLSHLEIDGKETYEGEMECFPEETFLPTTLTSLKIEHLRNLEYFQCKGIQHLTSLCKLEICKCPQLKILPFEDGVLSTLTDLEIDGLDNLTSLKGIHCLTSLQTLSIWRCIQLQSLSEEGLPPLLGLTIKGCPLLKSVPEDGLPSTITSLSIWEIESLKSLNYKGLQHLTRLKYLSIDYCRELQSVTEDALPSSLVILAFIRLDNVVSMDHKGFQQLCNLTQMYIFDCQKLQSLPEEGLPPSLSYLCIRDCPELEERCDWEGEYWPKISHIPSITVGRKNLK